MELCLATFLNLSDTTEPAWDALLEVLWPQTPSVLRAKSDLCRSMDQETLVLLLNACAPDPAKRLQYAIVVVYYEGALSNEVIPIVDISSVVKVDEESIWKLATQPTLFLGNGGSKSMSIITQNATVIEDMLNRAAATSAAEAEARARAEALALPGPQLEASGKIKFRRRKRSPIKRKLHAHFATGKELVVGTFAKLESVSYAATYMAIKQMMEEDETIRKVGRATFAKVDD